jgi:hypothetical protein
MKVKMFFGSISTASVNFLGQPIGNLSSGIDAEINEWFRQNPNADIFQVSQSQSGGSLGRAPQIAISVWYK